MPEVLAPNPAEVAAQRALPSSTLFACQAHKGRLNARKNKALVFWPKPSCSDTLFRLGYCL